MPVEREGVKGYEYQYLATVYLSLLYMEKDDFQVYVEDTEDARLVFTEDGAEKELYLQSKKHETSITLGDFCAWLTHFGQRQSEEFLLSRMAKPNHSAVFFSAGRCSDELVRFVKQEDFHVPGDPAFSKEYLDRLRRKLPASLPGTSELDARRKSAVSEFAGRTTNNELRAILRKISIAEQYTYEELLRKTTELLTTRYVVSPSSAGYAAALLDECVRAGRDTGQDAAGQMKAVIRRYSSRILPDDIDYAAVPNQKECEEVLENRHVLLLTGVPFCGKTSIAKFLAQSYAQRGYEVGLTTELEGEHGAFAFMNSCDAGRRILLLEDPFGLAAPETDRLEHTQGIYKLAVQRASSSRKMIVTSRLDLLLEAYGKKSIQECSAGGHVWFDQTLKDVSFAREYWAREYGTGEESLALFERIRSWLQRQSAGDFFEIGEINNLKRLYPTADALSALSMEQIYNDARISSASLRDRIAAEGEDAVRAFLCLGFCCDTINAASMETLAYALSASEETPALIRRSGKPRSVSISSAPAPKPEFPRYAETYQIPPAILKWFRRFEQRGYLFRDRISNEVCFAHPIFCHAGRMLLSSELEDSWDCRDITLLGTHGISALDKRANLCALDMAAYCADSGPAGREVFLPLMLQALSSIFPAAKDRAALLLERRFDTLTQEQQDVLAEAVKYQELDRYLLWEGDEPFLYPGDQISLSWKQGHLMRPEPLMTLEEARAIKSRRDCSLKAMYSALKSAFADELPFSFLKIAMTCQESAVREEAVYLIFKNHGPDMEDVSLFLPDFENANVIFALFRGALAGWSGYGQDSRNQILACFIRNLRRCSVSIQAKGFLDSFGRSRALELARDCGDSALETELWTVWGRVFAEFFRTIPPRYLRMDEAHMEYTVSQAMKHISNPAVLLELLQAWNEWLCRCPCPTDYGMCLMENLLKGIPASMPGRGELFDGLITARNTSVITSHVMHMVDSWDFMTSREKEAFFALLRSGRNDAVWLKAVALTRQPVPEDVQRCVCGECLLEKAPGEAVSGLRAAGLLEPCLNVYCGYPQTLWYNGYHHSGQEFWDGVLSEVLTGGIPDRAYEIALREFLDCEYNKDPRFQNTRDRVWDCILSSEENRKRTFSRLLHTSCTQTQTNKGVWDRYFAVCGGGEKEEAYREIAGYVEVLEYRQAPEEGIEALFGLDVVLEHIYPLLDGDQRVRDLCEHTLAIWKFLGESEAAEDRLLSQLRKAFALGIRAAYKEMPPRLRMTNNLVRFTMDRIKLAEKSLDQLLEERRVQLIDTASEHDGKLSLDDGYRLSDWND